MIKYIYKYLQKRNLKLKTFIGIEYLAALALINVYNSKSETKVKFDTLNEYGIQAMKKFDKENIQAVVLFSSEYAERLIKDYSDCFSINNIDGDEYLELKISVQELQDRFMGYLSLDILMALMSQDVVEVL